MTNQTNYNERLDEVLNWHSKCREEIKVAGVSFADEKWAEEQYRKIVHKHKTIAKQDITSLIKELVAEAKPPVIDTPSRTKLYADDEGQMWYDRGQNDTIARFEQNLLKALEEV